MQNDRPWIRRGYIALAAFVVVGAIVFLALAVVRDLQNLESARSDNLQWNLSQVEVEFLEFSKQLSTATIGMADDLGALRQRFDIFYSRIATLEDAAIYKPLMEDASYVQALMAVRTFLDETVPLIDADDARLAGSLPDLSERVDATRTSVRTIANSAVDFFAAIADQRRFDFAQTLLKLGTAIVVLFAALGTTIFYLRRLNIQSNHRQREVEETATRMDTVLQTSLDGVIVADVDGNILAFNAAAEAIFGHDAQDVMGQQLGPLIVPDHMLSAHDAGMKRMREGGEKRVVGKGRVQLEAKHSDGSIFPVELAIQTAETTEGTLYIAFLRDISERVAADKELISARDKALAADRLKTEFLATMSHELRTPLNGLLGNLSLLQDTKLNPNQLRYINNMDTSGELLLQHVTDVLDLSRYDVANLELRAVPLNLATVFQAIVDSQSGIAANNNTTIEWNWIGTPANWVETDPDAIQHIFMNLIGNAVKFTGNGKVSITLEVDAMADDIVTILFRIKDTGLGMGADLQDQIFDDFVTGNVAYDRNVGGTGLGLGIVRRSVAALDGEITVDSTPDIGSTFKVRLPLKSTVPIDEHSFTDHGAVEPLSGLHILIVEDNEINRTVTREMLRADGHLLAEVHDGKAAVELAENAPFDLILMDISMPVMDGRAATRAIRGGNGPCVDTPIVALTANAMASEQAAFLEDGMNGVLIKPLSRKALREQIRLATAMAIETNVMVGENSNEMRDILGDEAYVTMRNRFTAEAEDLHLWLRATPLPALTDIAERCHKVAGSAALFSANAYRAALIEIEDAAKVTDTANVRGGIETIDKVWRTTKSGL